MGAAAVDETTRKGRRDATRRFGMTFTRKKARKIGKYGRRTARKRAWCLAVAIRRMHDEGMGERLIAERLNLHHLGVRNVLKMYRLGRLTADGWAASATTPRLVHRGSQ
jgi:hypothetical protein